jgi:hypothetical protein
MLPNSLPTTRGKPGRTDNRFACQRAMAMPADTAVVITGSGHCGGRCDGCAKISPMNVTRSLFDAVAGMTGLTPLVRELEARLAADVELKGADA